MYVLFFVILEVKMKYDIVIIKEEYFVQNQHFVEMLDPKNIENKKRRMYLLSIKINEKNCLIPFRSNISNAPHRAVFPLPTQSRPSAGLDFRKMLIVSDYNQIERVGKHILPKKQKKILDENIKRIETYITSYIKGYKRATKNHLQYTISEYKFSTLHNFHQELGIRENIKEKKKKKTLCR